MRTQLRKLLAVSLLALYGFGLFWATFQARGVEEEVGLNFPDAQWYVIDQFTGFQTKADASKIDKGGNPNGQNTIINDGDRISIRPFGITVLGTATTTDSRITSLHTFRKRSGENILIRTRGTWMEYFEEGNDLWESVTSTFSNGSVFGFADYNINTDQRSYTYFGNAVDPYGRWSGAHTMTNGAVTGGAGTITVDDTADFPSSGRIRYCDTEIAYSGKTLTTFTVSSAHACADNRGINLVPELFPAVVKGNILLNANNRIFIGGITSTPQAVYFSEYGVATNFVGATLVTTSTASSPGIFNLGEGGGAVTGMALEEGAIYIFKKAIIYKATLSDSLYTLQPLKPFDGKSQTTGAVTRDMVFSSSNGVYFTSPDKQIMHLARVESVDYPQIIPISDAIKPTVESIVFTSSTGITFQDHAYIAVKSDDDISANDSVLLWNERRKTWESPIIGWNVGTWTIYDDGDGEALYFGDALLANVYKVTDDAIDNELGVTANWRSKRFDFGLPQEMKEIDDLYIEGYISDNTTLTVSFLLDENGYTQTYTANFAGTEADYIFNPSPFNLFGFHPFGFERFGSSDQTGKKKFRVYLNKNLRQTPFYNMQIEFSSDGVAQDWEIVNFAVRYRRASQPTRRTLFRNFQ